VVCPDISRGISSMNFDWMPVPPYCGRNTRCSLTVGILKEHFVLCSSQPVAMPTRYGPTLVHGLSYKVSNCANGSCILETTHTCSWTFCRQRKWTSVSFVQNNTVRSSESYPKIVRPLRRDRQTFFVSA
jgi:hypothetical protein